MMLKKYFPAMLLSVLFALLVVGVTSAQQLQPTPSDDQVNAIARQLYCPVCENTPLDVCSTTACAQWRDLIRQQLAEGWTDQAIKDYFVNQYGARVLGTPPPKGLNLLVYIIPPLAILAGIFVLFRAFRAWKKPATQGTRIPSTEGPPTGLKTAQEEYIKRLEDEVRKQ